MLAIIGMLGVSYALLRTKTVQTWSVKQLANYLSEQLQATMSIGGLDIDLTGSIVLEKVAMQDQQHRPFIAVERLGISYRNFNRNRNKLTLGILSLDEAAFHLHTDKKGNTNLQFLEDYFSSPDSNNSPSKPFLLAIKNVYIENSSFEYLDDRYPLTDSTVFDVSHTQVSHFNLHAEYLNLQDGAVRASIKHLSLQERCGFVLDELRGNATVDSTLIEVQQLDLRTPNSSVSRYFSMRYPNWDGFGDIFKKVRFYTTLDDANVSLKDIRYFTNEVKDIRFQTRLSGTIAGPLEKLESKKLSIKAGDNASLTAKASLSGLPDVDKLYLNASVFDGQIQPGDANRLGKTLLNTVIFPNSFDSLGRISFAGNFKGLFTRFETDMTVQSAAGNLTISGDLTFNKKGIPEYNGLAAVKNFDLGRLFQMKSIGRVSGEAQFTGRSFSIKDWYENTFITINQIELNHYTYQNITINGTFDRKLFEGAIHVDDKNLKLAFQGGIDFNNDRPAFRFNANIDAAHLNELHVYDKDASLHSSLAIDMSGDRLKNIVGTLSASSFSIRTIEKEYRIEPILFTSSIAETQQHLSLSSPLVDVDLKGIIDPATLIPSAKVLLKKYLPSFDWGAIGACSPQAFDFFIQTKNLTPITELLLPDLHINSNNLFRGEFNSLKETISLSGKINNLKYKNVTATNIIVDEENNNDRLDIGISCDKVFYNDSLLITTTQLSNTIRNDSLSFNIKLGDDRSTNSFDLNGQIAFNSDSLMLTMLPSIVSLDHQEWAMNDRFNVLFEKDRINIDNFSLSNNQQTLFVNGILSAKESDGLNIEVQTLDLSVLNPSLKPFSTELGGTLNGRAIIYEALGSPKVSTDFDIDQLSYNKTDIAKSMTFQSNWDQRLQQLSFSGNLLNKYLKPINLDGKIFPRGKQNLEIHLQSEETSLSQIEPFTTGIVSQLTGTATADIAVTGTFKQPILNGSIALKDAVASIDYLKNRLRVDNRTLTIQNNRLDIDNLILTDESGKQGVANGSIAFNDLSNPYFNIDLRASELLCLNTKASDNELYYGKARASGRFSFEGSVENMRIDIQATTAKGTQFFIPLSSESSLAESGLVTFVNKKDSLYHKRKQDAQNQINHYEGITLNMDLDVNENAQAQLIFDKRTGDIMKGSGNGNLKLRINTLGDFEMYGEYEISQGEYLFTLQNLINKRLKVSPGSTIRWNGDPYKAQVDLTAIYQTTAPVIGLYQAAEYKGKISKTDSARRVAVDCKLLMQNSLFSPDVSFDLDLPRNPEVRSELSSYLNNKDNVNSQVLSLLIASRFTGDLNAASGAGAGTLEVLSNQFSNYLSGIYKGLNVNINSLNGAGGSLSFLDDRININGNVITYQTLNDPTKSTTTQRANTVTGDVTAEYKISKNGNFRAKAFNKTITNDLALNPSDANQNIQGLGLLYRAEFDNIGDLWRKIWGIKPKDSLKEQ